MSAPVYIGTTNDGNGNPRRGWIVDYGRESMRFVEEGYAGRGALRAIGEDVYAASADSPRIAVTPGEYASWVRFERYRVSGDA